MTFNETQATLRSARRASAMDRLIAAIVALGALATLATASALSPSGDGFGTHEQLGLPPCTWAAFLDRPCPTCGMTTSFAAAANGDFVGAVAAQPFGAALAIFMAVLFWGAAHVAATGSRLGRYFNLLLQAKALWIAGAMLAAAWGYKLVTWPGFGG